MQTLTAPCPAPNPDDDLRNGWHDHALSEFYRAADDLRQWYSADELYTKIVSYFALRDAEK